MTFLAPFYFWTFLALIPLVGIYFLKVRPQRKQTSALFLWQRVFEEKRRTALFRRLRDVFSLLLVALAFAAIALALTDPEVGVDERTDLFLVIDHSVSMRAGQRTSSLDQAKEKARDLVRGLRGSQRAAVIAVASQLRFRSHLSNNPRALLEAVNEISSTDLPLSVGALEGLEVSPGHRVILITDGVADAEELPTGVEVIRVGSAEGNVGIVAADLQHLPIGEGRLGLYFQLASSFGEPRKFDLIVRRSETSVIGKLIEVTVEPGVNAPEVYTLEEAETGAWEVELDLEDALAEDNRAFLVTQQRPPIRVEVAIEDGYFFQKAVRAFEGNDSLVLVDESPDIVLAKSVSPEASLSLIFQPDGTSPWWSSLGDDLSSVVPKVVVNDHPALRYVDMATQRFVGARELEAPEGALVLVESDLGVPLIYLARAEGRAAVVVNIDPFASEFYFSAWFPVLIQSVSLALSAQDQTLNASYAVGDLVTLPGVESERAMQVTLPSGRQVEERLGVYGPVTERGFHVLVRSPHTWTIGASLFRSEETLLGQEHEQSDEVIRGLAIGSPLAWWLTLIAMAVLVIESILYHRRKVG